MNPHLSCTIKSSWSLQTFRNGSRLLALPLVHTVVVVDLSSLSFLPLSYPAPSRSTPPYHVSDESNHGPVPASLNGAFWVSIEEAAKYFVEAGVCMVRPRGGHQRRQGNGWIQEIRRRVSFARKGGTGWGAEVGATADRGRKEEDAWVPSRVYALSVYATSRMFFSLHQVCVRFGCSVAVDFLGGGVSTAIGVFWLNCHWDWWGFSTEKMLFNTRRHALLR